MELKVGDMVQLKSGGPVMTIRDIDGELAYCEWFDKGSVEGHQFALAQLEKFGER